MSLITRQAKGSKLTIQEMDGNLLWVNNLTEVTYAQLLNLAGNQQLVPGQHYLITDFRTCYDRPDYDINKNPIAVSNDSYVESKDNPIVVLATANDRIALEAYQPSRPLDSIKYDPGYTQTESGNPAFGRIIERIDEFGNRTDYDHLEIEFKRYRLLTYNKLSALTGTIEFNINGLILGTDTLFTNLIQGDIIAIPGTPNTFYKIQSITNDTEMYITGVSTSGGVIGGLSFYNAFSAGYDSYYPNNVDDPTDFELYSTFAAADGCYNTYIGDNAKYFNQGIGDFLLANNVLKDGRYENNTIGDSSYNNTFNDDCTANRIGYGFRNNITDDDFDSNVIGNFFENNIITANFQYNQIGINFQNNTIFCSSFYRNQIGNDFNNNWLDGDWGFDFQNNQIGNQFNNNAIYKNFIKNFILNGYNQNETWDQVEGNQIGNGFNGNTIYSRFRNNEIKEYFINNILSNQNNIGTFDFFNNKIMNNFENNTITGNFAYNKIGSEFQSNSIATDFGFGGGDPRGNIIGNSFQNNIVGEYFYDNIICDNFRGNTIIDDFKFNQILYPMATTDFSLATHVYADYNCRIFKGSDNKLYLEYFLYALGKLSPQYVVPTD